MLMKEIVVLDKNKLIMAIGVLAALSGRAIVAKLLS
jgi:hypothetical protein